MKKVLKFLVFTILSFESGFTQTAEVDENKSFTLAYPSLSVTVNNNPSPGHLFFRSH